MMRIQIQCILLLKITTPNWAATVPIFLFFGLFCLPILPPWDRSIGLCLHLAGPLRLYPACLPALACPRLLSVRYSVTVVGLQYHLCCSSRINPGFCSAAETIPRPLVESLLGLLIHQAWPEAFLAFVEVVRRPGELSPCWDSRVPAVASSLHCMRVRGFEERRQHGERVAEVVPLEHGLRVWPRLHPRAA